MSAFIPFTPEELTELAAFDAEIEGQHDYDPSEVEAARLRDQSILDERVDPKRLRKRKADREYYRKNNIPL